MLKTTGRSRVFAVTTLTSGAVLAGLPDCAEVGKSASTHARDGPMTPTTATATRKHCNRNTRFRPSHHCTRLLATPSGLRDFSQAGLQPTIDFRDPRFLEFTKNRCQLMRLNSTP